MPPIPLEPITLASRINISVHQVHADLNRRIIALLPLALPPHADGAVKYAAGMMYILYVYEAMESSLKRIASIPQHRQTHVTEAVGGLYIPSLLRSARLRMDLTRIRYESKKHSANKTAQDAMILSGLSGNASKRGKCLSELVHQLNSISHANSHLMFAYSHMFYLAVFSGGRYIHSRLKHAGLSNPNLFFPSFSCFGDAPETSLSIDEALSFWTFEDTDPLDGEHIKNLFKSQFRRGELSLSEMQKDQIVSESKWIMDSLLHIVDEITEKMAVDPMYSSSQPKLGNMRHDGDTPKVRSPEMTKNMVLQRRDPSFRLLLFKHLFPLGLAELDLAAAAAMWAILRYPSSKHIWKTKAG